MSKLEDPREAGPKPPLPKQEQEPPGLESKMEPRPDYGYDSYEGHGRLTNRVALITGGDSGIGRAVALAFAREGADVLVSYLEEHSDAQETVGVVEEAAARASRSQGTSATRSTATRWSTEPWTSSAAWTSSSTTPRSRWSTIRSPRSRST